MGTRGSFGFKTEKNLYMCFNPMDSYPSGLGEYWFKVVKNEYDLNHMKEVLDNVATITLTEGAPNLKEDMVRTLGLKDLKEAQKVLDEYEEIGAESDTGIFDALYEGRLDFFLNDKKFLDNTLFCEWAYYYDYTTEKFVIINNHEEKISSLSLNDEDWQKFFKMLE